MAWCNCCFFTLLLQAADGFLFVVGCDRGRILYVSESVSKVLNFSQASKINNKKAFLININKNVGRPSGTEPVRHNPPQRRGQSQGAAFLRWSQPKRKTDRCQKYVVKYHQHSVWTKLVLAMLPVKTDVPQSGSRLCPGARRSFFCRMKCKLSSQIKEEADTTTGSHRRKKQHNAG